MDICTVDSNAGIHDIVITRNMLALVTGGSSFDARDANLAYIRTLFLETFF